LAVLAYPSLPPISLLWLLIQLSAGTRNSLNSKSKETFCRAQAAARKQPSSAKNFNDCSDKVALIDYSYSINQVWPGEGVLPSFFTGLL